MQYIYLSLPIVLQVPVLTQLSIMISCYLAMKSGIRLLIEDPITF